MLFALVETFNKNLNPGYIQPPVGVVAGAAGKTSVPHLIIIYQAVVRRCWDSGWGSEVSARAAIIASISRGCTGGLK